jgi:hypothetical protein
MNTPFRLHARSLALGIALFGAASARAQSHHDFTPWLISDRASEVALARTAAPARISDSATVLVLTNTGFVEAQKGTNGFSCAVLRGFDGASTDPNFWNSNIRSPICLNPAAARTVLPRILKRTEWLMSNVPLTDVDARTKAAFASHEFKMPEAGAMAYMLSPKQYLSTTEPHSWLPHLMFFYDRSMGAQWGAGDGDAPIIDGTGKDSFSPITTILIPLAKWSDGSEASTH